MAFLTHRQSYAQLLRLGARKFRVSFLYECKTDYFVSLQKVHLQTPWTVTRSTQEVHSTQARNNWSVLCMIFYCGCFQSIFTIITKITFCCRMTHICHHIYICLPSHTMALKSPHPCQEWKYYSLVIQPIDWSPYQLQQQKRNNKECFLWYINMVAKRCWI